MAKSAPKFYVVWKGRKPGVYASWDACKAQVEGMAGALYKSYPSQKEADAAYKKGPSALQDGGPKAEKPLSKTAAGRPMPGAMAVDAACNMVTGVMEYQGVEIEGKRHLFRQGPFKGGTNNVGEYLALVHALAYCKRHGLATPIYSDSRTALAWLKKKKHGSKLEQTPANAVLFDLLDRADAWLAENAYPNKVLKWETEFWGENPADFGRK